MPAHMFLVDIDDGLLYVQAEKVPSAGGENPQQLLCTYALYKILSKASGDAIDNHNYILGSALES